MEAPARYTAHCKRKGTLKSSVLGVVMLDRFFEVGTGPTGGRRGSINRELGDLRDHFGHTAPQLAKSFG